MIANGASVLIGLWLAYGAIFSAPPGNVNNIQLAIAAILIMGCAIAARYAGKMIWQSSKSTMAFSRWWLPEAARVSLCASRMAAFRRSAATKNLNWVSAR